MEDWITSFFLNGIKLHIESSFNKYEEINSIIFKEDFEENFLKNIFINTINLFRDIISQNNLNFPSFWSHIGKVMKSHIDNYVIKFEEEVNREKNNIGEENKVKIDLGEINILKLKFMNISFFLITNVESENFLNVKIEEKEILERLFNAFIKINQERNEDFSEFIKNYIIKISLLISENSRIFNSGFLKYLSFSLYNMMQSNINNEQIKHLKIYIDHVINNPKLELNNYTNFGALNKKISDFFKKDKIVTSMNKSSSKNSLNNNNEENKENDIKKPESKISSYSFGQKNLLFPSGSELNLMNFGSGISNISHFSFGNNMGNGSNKISLDDSLNLSSLFPKPSSENEKSNKFKNLLFKCPVIPSVTKSRQIKRKKLADKLKDKELDIRKFINKKRKKSEEQKEKEIKELREMVNSSFYGNENEKEENIIDLDEEKKIKIKEINIKKEDLNLNKEKNEDKVLIFKTPNKDDKSNQENINENIMKNIDMTGLQRNFKSLFEQEIYI